jgi:hypothetical protein
VPTRGPITHVVPAGQAGKRSPHRIRGAAPASALAGGVGAGAVAVDVVVAVDVGAGAGVPVAVAPGRCAAAVTATVAVAVATAPASVDSGEPTGPLLAGSLDRLQAPSSSQQAIPIQVRAARVHMGRTVALLPEVSPRPPGHVAAATTRRVLGHATPATERAPQTGPGRTESGRVPRSSTVVESYGSSMVKVAPCPRSLRTVTLPPCASTMRRVM